MIFDIVNKYLCPKGSYLDIGLTYNFIRLYVCCSQNEYYLQKYLAHEIRRTFFDSIYWDNIFIGFSWQFGKYLMGLRVRI